MDHRQLDQRSLVLARAIAGRLLADPGLIQVAHDNLQRWQARSEGNSALSRCYAEWSDLLARHSVAELAELLQRDDEESARLRQNSPFVGILNPQEVWQIKRNFKPEASHAS